ncbi:MAG: hypothetical protein WBD07_03200 [Vicinamibacterales bacterium]
MLPTDDVVAINYYTALVSARPGNPSAPNDQQIYLRALRTIPDLSITYGHFLTHSVQMSLTGVTPAKRVWVDKTEEKGSDVNIASHLIRDAYLKRFDVAVLMKKLATFLKRIRQSHLIASQFPADLQDAKGAFRKPANWWASIDGETERAAFRIAGAAPRHLKAPIRGRLHVTRGAL